MRMRRLETSTCFEAEVSERLGSYREAAWDLGLRTTAQDDSGQPREAVFGANGHQADTADAVLDPQSEPWRSRLARKEEPPRRAAFPVELLRVLADDVDDEAALVIHDANRGRPHYPHTPLQVPSMPKKAATSPV